MVIYNPSFGLREENLPSFHTQVSLFFSTLAGGFSLAFAGLMVWDKFSLR